MSDCVGAAYRPMFLSGNQNEEHDVPIRSMQIRTIVNRVFYIALTTLASSQGLLGAIKIASLSPAVLLITTTTTLVMELFTIYTIEAIGAYIDHYTDELTFQSYPAKESIRIIMDVAEHIFYYYQAYRSTGLELAVRAISAVIVTLYSPTLQNIVLSVTSSD